MFCTDVPNPIYFIFSSAASPLLYYSHIPTVVVALVMSVYVFVKKRSLVTTLLLLISVFFGIWNFVDLVLWTNTDSRIIMSFWSTLYLLQAIILACTWYFSSVFLNEKDVTLSRKLIMGILLLPLIILLPTHWNLSGFDLANCEAYQGPLVKYFYFFQGVVLLWIFGGLIRTYRATADVMEKKKVALFSVGIFLFLFSFSWGNLFGSLTLNWGLEQYGLFGMPVFIGLLAFLIVQYKAFEIKLLGAQALVFALVLLIGAQLFFIKTTTNTILTLITLLIATGFGFFLIKSVKEEVQRKEELQAMASRLALANEELRKLDNAKSEFISIASHQLRTPLTAIKGFLSLVLEGSYGTISGEIEDVMNKVYTANSHLVDLVEDLLNVSRLESGRMQYQFAPADIGRILEDLHDTFSVIAHDRGIGLSFDLPEKPLPDFIMDAPKIREVVSNLIDNAIKYTREGSVRVKLGSDSALVRVIVEDTGIGILPEDIGKLFQKFRRGTGAGKVNVSGTGLGLYVGRSFAEAHGGRLFVESDGPGKGSRFILELPLRREEKPAAILGA